MKGIVILFAMLFLNNSNIIFTMECESILAHYPFDGNSMDYSGNNYHGIEVNYPTYTDGVKGEAIKLVGKGYYISMSDNESVTKIGSHVLLPKELAIKLSEAPGFRISFWVNESSLSHTHGESYIWFGTHDQGWLGVLHLDKFKHNDRLEFAVGGNENNAIKKDFNESDLGKWVFYELNYSSGVLSIFKDNKLVGTKKQNINIKINKENFAVGRHWWNYGSYRSSARFTGMIDDLKIYTLDKIDLKIKGNNICGNETVTLSAIPNDESYIYEWNTGDTTASIEVSEAGEYSVIVTKDNCSGVAEFEVEQFPLPEFTIEGETKICKGKTTTLTASKEFEEYEWSNGETTRSITVGKGVYNLTVTDSNGCVGYSEVEVIFEEDLTMEIIAPDSICHNTEVEISADRDYAEYEWSTKETTKSINITGGGKYWLHVVTEGGCEIEDTIYVEEYQKVNAELRPTATEICEGDSTFLESKFLAPFYEYYWNTGDSTHGIYVKESGDYQLLITDTRTGCKDSAEIKINVEDELKPTIEGSDICEGGSTILIAKPNNPNYSYKWSTGETEPQIEVNESGTYTVEVSTERCSGTAEFEVKQHPLPEFTIEGDTIVCKGETTTLTANKEFIKYEWSNGESTRSINVGEGDYTLTVTDSNGCTASREIEVEERVLTFDISKNSIDFGKVYISETKKDSIEVINTSGFDVVVNDEFTLKNGQTYQFNKTLDPDKIGQYNEELTLNITDPCDTTLTFSVTAEVYARVTLSTIELHTEIGATETVPYYLEAEADLGEQEFNITTDIDRDLFFTNDSYQLPSPQAINQQRTQVHEQTGTILLAELYEYPITFPQVEFDNPYIEEDTIPGKITFDEICIHDLRLIHTYAPTEVSVAPNPARDIINIDITTGEEGNFTIELISTEGRTTYKDSWNQSSSSKNIQIDTRDISTGVYQLRLTTEGHIYRKEVVVVD